jgi:hypothetical protein
MAPVLLGPSSVQSAEQLRETDLQNVGDLVRGVNGDVDPAVR